MQKRLTVSPPPVQTHVCNCIAHKTVRLLLSELRTCVIVSELYEGHRQRSYKIMITKTPATQHKAKPEA